MTTITDIAQRLGVAVSTVSKALNNAGDISDATKQLILNTAVEMGYASRKVQKLGTRKICVLVDDPDYERSDPLGAELMTGFKLAATENRWQVSVEAWREAFGPQESFDAFMLRSGYTGALILGQEISGSNFNPLKSASFPVVTVGCHRGASLAGNIFVDFSQGILEAAEHFRQLGHRNVFFLNGPESWLCSQQWSQCFRSAAASLGLNGTEAFSDPEMLSQASWLETLVDRLLRQGNTAVLCADGTAASRMPSVLSRLGQRVPEDVSVIGFGELPLGGQPSPKLTTIYQDCLSLGKSAFFMLDGLRLSLPLQTMLLRPRLAVGETTGPCKFPG